MVIVRKKTGEIRLCVDFRKLNAISICDSFPLPCVEEALQAVQAAVWFLGGLSLHLNHLIASHMANYDWPFGTLPFGLFGSNLDTRDLETYPRTYSGHF